MSLKETPLLYTDLLSPNSLAKNKDPFELGNDVIPIKTWASGSPLKNKGKFAKDDLSGILGDGTMESYFAKAFGDPADEEGEIEEDENENELEKEEDYDEEDDKNYKDEEETEQYIEDTDFDEYENENDEEYGDNEEQEYQPDEETDYEQATEENAAKAPLYSDLIELIDSYEEMKEEVLRDSGSNIPSRQKQRNLNSGRNAVSDDDVEAEGEIFGEESEDTATSIMNEYKDLLSYIKTPRGGNDELRDAEDDYDMVNPDFDQLFPKHQKNKQNVKKEESQKKKSLVKKATVSEVMVDKGSIVHFGSKSQEEEEDYYVQKEEHKKSKKSKSKKQHKKIPELLPSNKKSHPLLRNKATKDNSEKAKMTQASRKHKEMLSLLVSKRKEEEEELLALAAKAEERRKKFKQALLEKALSRKEEESVSPPPVVEPKTKATISMNVPPHSGRQHPVIRKTPAEVELESEEAAKEQEEKREHVAGIRRKFKEQHKNLLLSLMLKKKEEELLVSSDLLSISLLTVFVFCRRSKNGSQNRLRKKSERRRC
jgi:hypothetical protein